jgi:hypothetical protein
MPDHATLTRHSTFDLIEAFTQPGCAMCTLLLHLADRTVQLILYERSDDAPTHAALRARRGLCGIHAQQMTRYLGNAQTNALFWKSAVDEVVKSMGRLTGSNHARRDLVTRLRGGGKRRGTALAEQIAPSAPCLVCASLATAEQHYIEDMATRLDDERLCSAYQRSRDGLCLPHFLKVLCACDDPAILRTLIGKQQCVWTQLNDDLAEFLAKAGFGFDFREREHEADSWLRAALLMPGAEGLFGVDKRD